MLSNRIFLIALLRFIVSKYAEASCSHPEDKWIRRPEGNDYIIKKDSQTYDKAAECCRRYRSKLISFADESEWKFIVSKVDPSALVSVWMGLTTTGGTASHSLAEGWETPDDPNQEAGFYKTGNIADPSTLTWKWADGSSFDPFWTHWIDPERGEGSGSCAVFYKPQSIDWAWRNVPCTDYQPYICEKSQSPPPTPSPMRHTPDPLDPGNREPIRDIHPENSPQHDTTNKQLSDQKIVGISLGVLALVIAMFAGGMSYRKFVRKRPAQEYYNAAEIETAINKPKKKRANKDFAADGTNTISTEALYNSNSTLEVVTPGKCAADNPLYHEEGVRKAVKPPPRPAYIPSKGPTKGITNNKGKPAMNITSVQNHNYCPPKPSGVSERKESVIYDDTSASTLNQRKPMCRDSDIYENNSKSRTKFDIQKKLNNFFTRQPPKLPAQQKRESEFQYDYIDPASLGY